MIVTRMTLLTLALAVAAWSRAQLSDAQAVTLAKPIVQRFAPESADLEPRIWREDWPDAAGGGTEWVIVNFGSVMVNFDQNGEFKSYHNGTRGVASKGSGGQDMYKTDDEAWSALERVLSHLDEPGGLYRAKLERADGTGRSYSYQFLMSEKAPGGHVTEWSNSVRAELHRVTGKLVSISIVDGWTFEPPNVQISSDHAREAVRARHGGNLDDHSATLKYTTVADKNAPAYSREMRRDKVLRLHYLVTNRATKGFAMVDAVTGDVVSYQVLTPSGSPSTPIEDPSEAKSPLESRETPSQSKVESSSSVRESTRRRSPLPLVLASVVALAVLGMLTILAKARK